MVTIYIFIIFVFTSSIQYKIIDLEPYRYIHYVDDLEKTNENIVIYKYQPQSNEKDIYISFLGTSSFKSFEFYLYSNLSDINQDEHESFVNFTDTINNFGETKLNYEFDIYYILVKMNSFEYNYKYLSFMIYNLKENMNIGKYDDYMLSFRSSKNFTFIYQAQNITKYLNIEARGNCDDIIYNFYNNNEIKPELIFTTTKNCSLIQYLNLTFLENNNYSLNIIVNSNNDKLVRMLFYFLDNDKYIKEVKSNNVEIKYSYVGFRIQTLPVVTDRFFFINIENIPINELISYNIYEPFNPNYYQYSYKFYKDYNFSELPKKYQIENFDYESNFLTIEENPMIFIHKNIDAKGLLLSIESFTIEDKEINLYNELIMYLYPKNLFYINESETFNYTKLLTKNVFYLYNLSDNLLMKSNLDYFKILYPKRKVIKSKSYLFDSSKKNYIFEIQISEKASVELKFINYLDIISLENPDFLYLCDDNIEEEKYIYLPYMTDFTVLFGNMEIYEINVTSLKSLDEIYNESYMEGYNILKRYSDYYSNKEEQYFYKLKCTSYSLLKYEDNFVPYNGENITINEYKPKVILDFSLYNQKNINFINDLALYIGIIDTTELNSNKNFTLNVSFNNEPYSLNIQNEIFFKDVKKNDILTIKKLNKNIYIYIKTVYNHTINKFGALKEETSGIFIFERNIPEEFGVLISTSPTYVDHGNFSFFYGNPKNFEYNQLINHDMEITINPYKYIKDDDKKKLFFLVHPYFSLLKIIKLCNIKAGLNQLFYVVKNYEDNLRIKLPKIYKEKKIAFIQYFSKEINIYNNRNELSYEYKGDNFKIYIFEPGMVPYFESLSNHYRFNSFYFITYINYKDYDGNLKNIIHNCNFEIKNVFTSYNNITIVLSTSCNSSEYNYTLFFEDINDNETETSISTEHPIQKLYNKNMNNITKETKIYEFKKKSVGNLEIIDSFERGEKMVTVIGQDPKEFNRIVFSSYIFDYQEKKKSYLAIIIIGSMVGVSIIIITILLILRKIKKKKMSEDSEEEKIQILSNKKSEESDNFKTNENSTDFKYYKEDADFNAYPDSADFKYYKKTPDTTKGEDRGDFKYYKETPYFKK